MNQTDEIIYLSIRRASSSLMNDEEAFLLEESCI